MSCIRNMLEISGKLTALTLVTCLLAPVAGLGSDNVELLVYKKWIGASGREANVEIHLACGEQLGYEARFINRDRPDGWTVENVPEEGVFCDVREIEQETFIADVSDCLNLLVIPGQPAECTMVNTKVVKRIDMLNRYGLFLMIAVMLGAGLAAVKRFGPY